MNPVGPACSSWDWTLLAEQPPDQVRGLLVHQVQAPGVDGIALRQGQGPISQGTEHKDGAEQHSVILIMAQLVAAPGRPR